MLAEKKGSPNLLKQSLIGIALGIVVGFVILWWFFPSYFMAEKKVQPKKRDEIHHPKWMTDRELYKVALKEVHSGQIGKALRHIEKKRISFLLRPHLLWQLSEYFLRVHRPQKAIPHYLQLLKLNYPLWSKKRLLYRVAYAYWKAGQKRRAYAYLSRSIRASLPSFRTKGYYWRQMERSEAAAALLFWAQLTKDDRTKANALFQLWTQFPDSLYAEQAEVDWWALMKRTHFRLVPSRSSFLFLAIKLYLTSFIFPKKAKILLDHLRRKSLSAKEKRRYFSLRLRWAKRWGKRRDVKRVFGLLWKEVPRKKRSLWLYRIAHWQWERGRLRAFWRKVKRIRKNRRYWRAKAAFEIARWYFKRGRFRRAKRYYKKAWKLRKKKAFRGKLYFDLGMMALIKYRYSRAHRYFKQALKSFRRPPLFYRYWLARSEERRWRRQAIQRYLKIFRGAEFSFYGFLAAQRLRLLGAEQPHHFARSSQLDWTIPARQGEKWLRLRLLKRHGPKELYLLELERIARIYRRPPLGLLLKIARLSAQLELYHVAIRWLQQPLGRYLAARKLPPRELLLAAYPRPPSFWPFFETEAKKVTFDARLLLALAFHQSYFQKTFRRGRFSGLMALSPFYHDERPDDPAKNIALASQKLLQLTRKMGSPSWAIEAYLHPPAWKWKSIARSFRKKPDDVKFFFLSKSVKRILQTYRLYQLLYWIQ